MQRVFYLAIPPSIYKPVAMNLGESGLSSENPGKNWCRIIVEKPFGKDIDSAGDLDRTIHIHFEMIARTMRTISDRNPNT